MGGANGQAERAEINRYYYMKISIWFCSFRLVGLPAFAQAAVPQFATCCSGCLTRAWFLTCWLRMLLLILSPAFGHRFGSPPRRWHFMTDQFMRKCLGCLLSGTLFRMAEASLVLPLNTVKFASMSLTCWRAVLTWGKIGFDTRVDATGTVTRKS